MADKNEADSPDESASAATPEGGQLPSGDEVAAPEGQAHGSHAIGSEARAENARNEDARNEGGLTEDALNDDALDSSDGSGTEADPHVAGSSTREPTLEELEQMLQGDDPDDHDGADLDPADEPAELADAVPDHDDPDSSDDGDGAAELVSVGAAPRTRGKTVATGTDSGTGTELARAEKERQKKDRATPKQKKDVEKPKRTTPAGFVRESVGELRKVVYPTAPQLGNYFVVVLVFVLVIIGFVGLLDLGFGWVIVKVFG